ncbi:MAG TPA: glycosyltransferase family 39 protein [Vicinamibacterales bacterium]|nr:glycosyltransferase family 39 protein [Vicinamibacterales bacterium]
MPYSRRFLLTVLVAALVAGAALRLAWPTADPPTHATVGVVWHDEGAWVHNARNRVLWGTWRTDNWNPMFIAPVFTALEAGAFGLFGVGTWQARTVPAVSGLAAIALLAAGLATLGGRRAAVIGAVLLATNYVFVMWNRAALMESTMTSLIVASWAAYAVAARRPLAGLAAGSAAVLAVFTKASAVFFVGAIGLDAAFTIGSSRVLQTRSRLDTGSPAVQRAAWWTLAGVVLTIALVAMVFVLPNWSEYRFYNWQMSVTRKPEYSVGALLDRASWLPIAHDFFTRMWLVTLAAALAIPGVAARWSRALPAERLLVLWVMIGLLELVVHDSGNERRYVMFIPALVALAALLLGREGPVIPDSVHLDGRTRWLSIPLLLLLAYLVIGSVVRLAYLYQIGPGVRLAAALSVAAVLALVWRWQAVTGWLAVQRMRPEAALLVAGLVVAGDLAQYWQWATRRTSRNYEASLALGRVLPPGTLVHGKLANGLSLENRIRPVFVGRGFGNYEDRKRRDDVRYILTYTAPRIGYEGSVIQDVLEAYPNRAIIMTFDVAETSSGHDKAALIDKFGGPAASPDRTGRAQD